MPMTRYITPKTDCRNKVGMKEGVLTTFYNINVVITAQIAIATAPSVWKREGAIMSFMS